MSPCCHLDRLGGQFLAPWAHESHTSGHSPSSYRGRRGKEGQAREAWVPGPRPSSGGQLRLSLQSGRHRSTSKHVYFGSLQVTSEQCAKIMTICGSEAF